jgi:HD-like signal output (HDOD) protein
MNAAFLERVIHEAGELTSLPQTLAEVLRVLRDERSSADQLARVLMKDPPLTAKVLRMANSPIYGTGQKIGSMIQAIRVLGDRQVTALALSSTVYDMTHDWLSSLDRMRFWRHALETAIASRMIGESLGRKSTEELFLAGLLHDIGLLILEKMEPKEFARIWNEAVREGGIVEMEYQLWGTSHAEIGGYLLRKWYLPEAICQPVEQHHDAAILAKTEPDFVPSQILMLGHMISKFRIAPEKRMLDADALLSTESLRSTLGIASERLIDIEKELTSTTIAEADYLEMNIGTIDDLFLEANRLLFEQSIAAERLADENRRLRRRLQKQYADTENVT